MTNIRISIFITTCILVAVGVVMVYSSSALYGFERWQDSLFFLKRHMMYLAIGALFMCAAMFIEMDTIKKYAKPIFAGSCILLFCVLIPGIGKEVQGARRWLVLGGYTVQPSEFAKLAVIIYLASFLSRKGPSLGDFFNGFVPPLMVIGFVAGLVLIEPDFGTAVSILVVGMLILFAAGARLSHLGATALASIPIFYYFLLRAPYRKRRLLAFLNPWADSRGTGFQLVQSFLAIGSGGLLGVGLGQSKQKLFYLPESHTDFIFSIIAEELGFIGAASVLVLFGVLVWQGMRSAFKVKDPFKKTIILGVVFLISLEAIINISVSTGTIPTKGLPLPFISYGGTSLVVHMLGIGLLLNASRG